MASHDQEPPLAIATDATSSEVGTPPSVESSIIANDEAATPASRPFPVIAETTLRDRACFCGVVNDGGLPAGHGVLYTALGTHTYAGTFVPQTETTSSRRLGAQLLPNGTLFAGEFEADDAHGNGVKRDPFGSQYVGQWHDGELHGPGLWVDVDGEARWGTFELNERVAQDAMTGRWDSTMQRSVLRALLVERTALQAEEVAREIEQRVLLLGLTTVGSEPVRSTDEIDQFTREEQAQLATFLEETKRQLQDVERVADRWKFEEAQLKEKQKLLRRDITDARTALAYKSKFVALAETRSAQLEDAECTLASLQHQIERLEQSHPSSTARPSER